MLEGERRNHKVVKKSHRLRKKRFAKSVKLRVEIIHTKQCATNKSIANTCLQVDKVSSLLNSMAQTQFSIWRCLVSVSCSTFRGHLSRHKHDLISIWLFLTRYDIYSYAYVIESRWSLCTSNKAYRKWHWIYFEGTRRTRQPLEVIYGNAEHLWNGKRKKLWGIGRGNS